MKSILSTICVLSILTCFASDPPNIKAPEKTTAIVAVSGEKPGVWIWDSGLNDVYCKPNSSGKCVTVVVTPKVAYTNLNCNALILELYTNSNAIEKVELYKGEVNTGNYLGEISSYSFSEYSDGETLAYTLGDWVGVYSGPISLNICTVQ